MHLGGGGGGEDRPSWRLSRDPKPRRRAWHFSSFPEHPLSLLLTVPGKQMAPLRLCDTDSSLPTQQPHSPLSSVTESLVLFRVGKVLGVVTVILLRPNEKAVCPSSTAGEHDPQRLPTSGVKGSVPRHF